MAKPGRPIYDKFKEAILRDRSYSESNVDAIIKNIKLNPEITPIKGIYTFQLREDIVPNLETFVAVAGEVKLGSGRLARRNIIGTSAHGEGAYGAVYKSDSNTTVYKKITASGDTSDTQIEYMKKVEYNLRTILLELFIQIVLSSDPTYGTFICTPTKLFRTSEVGRLPANTSHASYKTPVTLYIQMEYIQYKFEDYMNTLKTASATGRVEKLQLAPLLVQLGNTLHGLFISRNFRHGDLHCGNIMVTGSGNLKIIDFGMSCITTTEPLLGGPGVFSDTRPTPTACESYDLLLFLTSLYQIYYEDDKILSDSFAKEIKDLLNIPSTGGAAAGISTLAFGGVHYSNVYDYLLAKGNAVGNDTVFHQAYMEEINADVPLKGILPRISILEPRQFAAYFSGGAAASSAGSAVAGAATGSAAAVGPLAATGSASTGNNCAGKGCCRRPGRNGKPKSCVFLGGGSKTARNSRMKSRRAHRKSRRQHGAGYLTPAEFFGGPQQPSAGWLSSTPSTAPTANIIRPVLQSTVPIHQTGAGRRTRRLRGGFSPAVMGGFIPNAQAAIVPAALYLAYHQLVRKNGAKGVKNALQKTWKRFTKRK
jgi:serine/threonine protein kinase